MTIYRRSVFTPCKLTLQIILKLMQAHPLSKIKNISNVVLSIEKKQI